MLSRVGFVFLMALPCVIVTGSSSDTPKNAETLVAHLGGTITYIATKDAPPDSTSTLIDTINLRSTPTTDQHLVALMCLLRDMPAPRSIYIDNTLITDNGLSSVSWPDLYALSLSGTTVSDRGVQGLIASCPNLRQLDLSFTGLSNASASLLANLTHLSHLRLVGLPLSDDALSFLVNTCTLEELDLSRYPAADRQADIYLTDRALQHLRNLKCLRRLSLRSSRVSADGISKLSQLPALAVLDLGSTSIDDAAILCLRSLPLEQLILSHTNVSDAGARHLSDLSRLQKLDLSGTKVSDASIRHLARCPNLRSLYLCNTNIRFLNSPEQTVVPMQLEYLALDDLPIGDDSLRWIGKLVSLRGLRLTATQVTDHGIGSLQLPHLTFIDLGMTAVGDDGIRSLLERHPALQQVSILESAITDVGRELLTKNGVEVSDSFFSFPDQDPIK